MRRLIVLTMLAVGVMGVMGMAEPTANPGPGHHSYGRFPGAYHWYPGSPQVVQTGDGVGEVLASIRNPVRRQELAEDWLRFSKQAVAASWEFQKQWIELQKEYMRFQSEMERLRLEIMGLQAEIERLHVEKLRLEKEKLELQKEIAEVGAKKRLEG